MSGLVVERANGVLFWRGISHRWFASIRVESEPGRNNGVVSHGPTKQAAEASARSYAKELGLVPVEFVPTKCPTEWDFATA